VYSREGQPLGEENRLARFEQVVLPHLGAAYNLARWLTGDGHDAEDVVQEAYLRALQYFGGFHGEDGRAWLLKIVRNTCCTWLQRNRAPGPTTPFDEKQHGAAGADSDPEVLFQRQEDRQFLRQALEALPLEFREVLVLRELEGLSYKQIADITGLPLGTVMSRLARARERLLKMLSQRRNEGP
jgi:RNA polymerase sigma factor (sigma-70 family)